MVEYELKDLFKESVDKQLQISYDGGVITNANIPSEEFELTEGICSEDTLRFGSCEAAQVSFTVYGVSGSLKGKELDISMILDGNAEKPFRLGKYKVYSSKPTADRTKREIVAYDALYEVLNADVADWYHSILPNADSTVTLKEFRNNFFEYFGITQENISLVNDAMIVEKTINPSELSGKTVLSAILELNGAFGRMNRAGNFQYVVLEILAEGVYPADDLYPANDLYPTEEQGTFDLATAERISCVYEDFVTKKITKLQIRKEENDIGAVSGTGDNCYIIQDNFMCYGKRADTLQNIADNVLSVINEIRYRPATVVARGNPCLEPGDGLRMITKHDIVRTYILSRKLKGIQNLRDTYSAEGTEKQEEEVNSVRTMIVELRGKTNTLERTVEETKSTIVDMEKGLQSQITQTAKQITSKVSRDEVVSEINQSADMIELKGNRIIIQSDNFTVSENGTIIANNATLTGTFRSQGVTADRYIHIGDGILKTTFNDGSQYTDIQPGYLYMVNAASSMIAQITPGIVIVNGTISAGASGTLIGLLNSTYLVPYYNAGTYGPYIATSGSLQIATTNYAETAATSIAGNLIASAMSDFRLKQDVMSLDSMGTKEKWLEVLDEMKIKSFSYKPDTYELDDGKKHLGTVAQLLDNLLKEKGLEDYGLIRERDCTEKSRIGEYTGGEKPLGVDYVGMVPLLVLGYQSVRKELEEVKNELAKIKEAIGIE